MRVGVHRVGTSVPAPEQVENIQEARKNPQQPRSMKQILRGALMVFMAGVLWGFSGSCGQLLSQEYNVPIAWLVTQRLIWSGLFFLAGGMLFDRQNITRLLKNKKSVLQLICYAALGVICCQWFYLEAIAWTNAGTGTLMEQLGLILVLAVTCLQERRGPRRLEVIGLAMALIGVFLVSTHGDPTTLVLGGEGLLWGFAAALGAAFYMLLPVPLLREYSSFTVTAPAMIVGALIAIPLFHPWTYQVEVNPQIALTTAGMIICGTILAYLFFMQGVRDAGPVLAGLLNTVELLSAFLISHFWLGTPITFWDGAGCVCIMAMMVLMTLRSAKGASTLEPDNAPQEAKPEGVE